MPEKFDNNQGQPPPEQPQFEDTESNDVLHQVATFILEQQTLKNKILTLLDVPKDEFDTVVGKDYGERILKIQEDFKNTLAQSEFVGKPDVHYTTLESSLEDGAISYVKNKKYKVDTRMIDSDIVWGIHYKPTSHDVTLRNIILLEEAKSDIRTVINEELSKRLGISILLEDSFAHQLNERSISPTDPIDVGIISELMVRELLKRERNDQFSVERPTPADDFIFKFDFILKLQELKKHGIQVTIGSSIRKIAPLHKNLRRWRGELDMLGIDDFQILSFPDQAVFFKKAFNEWLRAGQPPGGPEQFLDPDIKSLILEQIRAIMAEPSHNMSRETRDHIGFSRDQVKLERRNLDLLSGEALLDEIIALRAKTKANQRIHDAESVIADIEPNTEEKVQAFIDAVKKVVDDRRKGGFLQQEPIKFSDAIKLFGKGKILIRLFPEIKDEIDRLRRKKYASVVEE